MAWIDYKKAYDVVPQSWIINWLKKYKISHETINFIGKIMKNWRVELTVEGKNLAETKIQRGIFQGDVLLLLLFIIAMMSLNHTLRKCTGGYKLSVSQEKINHLMYMDDIKLFAKKWKGTGNPNTHNKTMKAQGWNLALKNVLCSSWKVANDI